MGSVFSHDCYEDYKIPYVAREIREVLVYIEAKSNN